MPIQNITLNSVPAKALLQYTRRKRKRDDKTSSLLKDSSIENSSSLSALPNRPCEVVFKYSRNRRKKTPSCVVSEHEEALPIQNITLNPIPSKEVKIPDVCTLEQPRIGRVAKKLLILDVNGLLADIVSYASVGYQANIVVFGKSGEHCCIKLGCISIMLMFSFLI